METFEARKRAWFELQALRINIEENAAKLNLAEQEIVKEEFLKDFIGERAMEDFRRSLGRNGQGSGMLKWLKLEEVHERLKHQAEHRQKTLPSFRAYRHTARPSHTQRGDDEDFDDAMDDGDDEEATFDVLSSFQDNTNARRLEEDDEEDDLFFLDLELDDEVGASHGEESIGRGGGLEKEPLISKYFFRSFKTSTLFRRSCY